MDFNGSSPFPEGVISFLDTDLYKLTMQCAVLKYFSDVKVTYTFHNRTPEKKLSRAAFRWLQIQINSTLPLSLLRTVTDHPKQNLATLLSRTTNSASYRILALT
jgi:nicotinic acid phosphoribosyltransferase